ncbi:TPA: hypothetical protein ACS5Z6_005135 [Salmonella enterica]
MQTRSLSCSAQLSERLREAYFTFLLNSAVRQSARSVFKLTVKSICPKDCAKRISGNMQTPQRGSEARWRDMQVRRLP